jgi:hypothetical protein
MPRHPGGVVDPITFLHTLSTASLCFLRCFLVAFQPESLQENAIDAFFSVHGNLFPCQYEIKKITLKPYTDDSVLESFSSPIQGNGTVMQSPHYNLDCLYTL